MKIKCPGCQSTFETYRHGRQFCPNCGIQLDVPAPSATEVPREATPVSPQPASPEGQSDPERWGGAVTPPPSSGEPSDQERWGGSSAPPPSSGEPSEHERWGGSAPPPAAPPGGQLEQGQWGAPPQPPPPPGGPWNQGQWGDPQQPQGLQPSPWERRDQLGLFNALYQTWADSTLRPTKFFSTLAPGKLSDALIYAMIVTTIGSLFAYAWSGLYDASFIAALSNAGIDPGPMSGATAGTWLLGMLAVPIAAAIYIFIGGAILHLCCMIFGCASRGFDTTLRTLCYSTGAMIFGLVPFCGSVVAQVWGTVVTVIGITHQQQTTTGRAVGAVLLPLIVLLLCVCGAGVLMALGFAAFGAGF